MACTRLKLEQLKRLGAAVGCHRGSDEMMATRQLFQRLSLILMRGNAALRLADGQIMTLLLATVDGVELSRISVYDI